MLKCDELNITLLQYSIEEVSVISPLNFISIMKS